MQFGVTKDFNGGPKSGPFKIAKLTIVVLTGDPIEDPGKPEEFTQVDITVFFLRTSFISRMTTSNSLSLGRSTFLLPMSNSTEVPRL
jgi:hypothetical protein